MANKIRIKRRASGAIGAPSSLENAELAYNEVDDVLYYGKGTGGIDGTATTVEAIAGSGAYVTLSGIQAITGNKTFSGVTIVPTPTANAHAATKLYVDTAIGGVSTTFTVAGDGGTSQTITTGSDTLTISGGTGLSSLGGATDTITINLDNTAVVANSYGSVSKVGTFTVDSQGRLTAASDSIISLDLTTNGLTGTKAQFDTSLSDGTFVDTTSTQTLEAKTLVGSSYNANIVDVTALGALKIEGGNYGVTIASSSDRTNYKTWTFETNGDLSAPGNIIFEGSTPDAYETTLSITDPTADNVIALPNASGTIALVTDIPTSYVASITGTANEISIAGTGSDPYTGAITISLPDDVTIGNTLTVTGDLIVNGNTTTLNTATLIVEDKNIVLANVTSPTNTTANGAGISVLGDTDKTINWIDGGADAWTSSENFSVVAGKSYYINATSVLSNTTLGSGVIYSSLTTLGTIGTGVWNGTTIGTGYGGTGLTSYTTGDLVYASATNTLSARGIGTEGQFLKMVSGVPNWSDTVDGGTF